MQRRIVLVDHSSAEDARARTERHSGLDYLGQEGSTADLFPPGLDRFEEGRAEQGVAEPPGHGVVGFVSAVLDPDAVVVPRQCRSVLVVGSTCKTAKLYRVRPGWVV